MTSLQTSIKQVDTESGYFVTVGSLLGKVYGYNASAQTLSTASWAYFGPGLPLSTVIATGSILKDMGKTVVSSLRTFRKVQLVLPGTAAAPYTNASTFGVGGKAATTTEDYLTGYIELGFEGNGVPAPVAKFGR